ncbi:hypothetical protein [Paenibacillus sp. FJAT-26967]|uniref:hypothetical protein n=1 Tax=Paenibacillus sp. FJAT-26967 TaxID=1729690 RepID=UPI000837ACF3|nr:hypothetical protein [Paenibacillus sp. FJAT-26967]
MFPHYYFLEKEMEQHNRDRDRKLRDYNRIGRFLHARRQKETGTADQMKDMHTKDVPTKSRPVL